MEGIQGALARIGELQGRLSTLRPPAPPGQFDAALRTATAAPAAPASSAPATAATSAAWAAAQRPASLTAARPAATAGAPAAVAATYPNGKIPPSALHSIGGGESLRADAAQAFLGLREAAAKAGIDLPVNDSYRSFAEQEDMARRKGLYSEGGLAAKPGTSSHGLGLAVDLQLDGKALAWMREHGKEHGFVEDVPREPWHWTFEP